MKRLVLILCMVLCGMLTLNAQSGSEILGMLSEKLRAMDSYRIDFELEIPSAISASKGYCVVSGEKYKIAVEELMQGCDGTTMWTLNGPNMEVTFDTPRTDSRSLFDNPTKAFDFAEKLFVIESVTMSGQGEWQLVLLPAEGVLDGIERVVLNVDKTSGLPTLLGYDIAGVELSIKITKIASASTSPSDFVVAIPEGFEVIDFR